MTAGTALALSLLANVVSVVLLMNSMRAQKRAIYKDIGTLADNTSRLAVAFTKFVKRVTTT